MSFKKTKASEALHAAGYVRLPGLWATSEQIELILWMVKENLPEIQRIKMEARDDKSADMEEAWRKHEKEKNDNNR